jgi:methionyl-tRNA formyltransferase
MRPTPVKTAAQDLGLNVFEPVSLREFAAQAAAQQYDLFILASYGKILPQALLDAPKLGALNVHPSLLPKYRGATPIQTALLNGDTETGVTIMLMDAGMDTGDIVLQERTPIDSAERYGELHDRLARFGAQALVHAIDLARSGYIPRHPQKGKPIVTRPVRKDDLAIDWRWNAGRIVDTVRAYSPAPAARAVIRGEQVKILRAQRSAITPLNVEAGAIAGSHGDALVIRCGEGAVDVLELVPPNRRAMSGAEYLR